MKAIQTINLQSLSEEELRFTNGGSEFSESIARTIGWFAGAFAALGESFISHQEQMYKNGLHPAVAGL